MTPYDFGDFIEQRLRDRGPPPYSLCEARLGEPEYLTLKMWRNRSLRPG